MVRLAQHICTLEKEEYWKATREEPDEALAMVGLHISGCPHQVGHGWGWSRGPGLGHGWPPHLRWPAPGLGWGLGHGWPLVGWLSTWSASTSAPGCGHNWPLLPSSPQFSPLHQIGSNRLIQVVKFPELLHTLYLSFFLHGQNFWRIKFTPKKRLNYDKIHRKLPIFCVITAKYTVNWHFFALNL